MSTVARVKARTIHIGRQNDGQIAIAKDKAQPMMDKIKKLCLLLAVEGVPGPGVRQADAVEWALDLAIKEATNLRGKK